MGKGEIVFKRLVLQTHKNQGLFGKVFNKQKVYEILITEYTPATVYRWTEERTDRWMDRGKPVYPHLLQSGGIMMKS